MFETSHELEVDQELKFSGEQGYFDRSSAIRILILFIFVFSVFLFLYFREVKVGMLELNSVAPGYIVSQVDFDFVDDEATIILKQEALRDIGRVYRISEKDIWQKQAEFENFLLYNQSWRSQVDTGIIDDFYVGADAVEKILLQKRFTDTHTLDKLNDLDFPTEYYSVFSPNRLAEKVALPDSTWQDIEQHVLTSQKYPPLVAAVIIEFFKSSLWHIEEDIPAQKAIRKLIQDQVKEKVTHVSGGSRIIDQGEKVTARHIAMLQAMKKAMAEDLKLSHPLTLLGTLIMTLLFVLICLAYIKSNYPTLMLSNRKLALFVSIIVVTLLLAKLTEFFLLASSLVEVIHYPLFLPLAAILSCCLLNAPVAAFMTGFLAILFSLTLAFDQEGFLITNLTGASIAILNIRTLRRRKEILIVCLKAWLACVAAIFAIHFYNHLGTLSLLTDIASAGFFMLLTAITVVGLLPLLESSFKIMTDVTLMEYMDPNNDILRRLTLEAPGTYQHSVVVGNLAESAASAIGANGLFCRVATLYHDIGKMATSQYYTENQLGGIDMHQLLTPLESAQVIMAHVPEGIALARQAGLPEPFIDIIKEHHGTTLTYYFYRKQLDAVGGDKKLVDEKLFRYSGPKPRSKESGIIMIADSFEAASRSLEKINEESVTELLDRLVRNKIDDGQFNECTLTFREITIVKRMLVKTLLAAGHGRVKYPVQEREKDSLSSVEESASK